MWSGGSPVRVGGRVLLRIEDHDRQRCRPEYDAALLEDLDWLGFRADLGPVRQSGDDAVPTVTRSIGCEPTASSTAATARGPPSTRWAAERGAPWTGPGCPGGCRDRALDGPVLRVALGGGTETWMDGIVGPCAGDVAAPRATSPIRDRARQLDVRVLRSSSTTCARAWTSSSAAATCSTPRRTRSGSGAAWVGRAGRRSPTIRLIRRPDGSKLSKADGATPASATCGPPGERRRGHRRRRPPRRRLGRPG